MRVTCFQAVGFSTNSWGDWQTGGGEGSAIAFARCVAGRVDSVPASGGRGRGGVYAADVCSLACMLVYMHAPCTVPHGGGAWWLLCYKPKRGRSPAGMHHACALQANIMHVPCRYWGMHGWHRPPCMRLRAHHHLSSSSHQRIDLLCLLSRPCRPGLMAIPACTP